jgi:hypothetical protein
MGRSVAKRPTTTLKRIPPIADVVRQIKTHIEDAAAAETTVIKHRLAAGQLLLQLRRRIEAGEEGDVAWWDWFEKQDMGRGRKDCERLMRIASAEDPEAALADDQAKTRDRVRRLRAERTVRSKTEDGTIIQVIEYDDDEDEPAPNKGCNYDPADPRGFYKDEDTKVVRRRAWLVMAGEIKMMAESFLAEDGHRAIAIADPAEIDDEIIEAARGAALAWERVVGALEKKRASTLPQDGRSETPENKALLALERELKAHKKK